MTKIMPDFRAYCKQDKIQSCNDLGQDYPFKLPTRIRDEPHIIAIQGESFRMRGKRTKGVDRASKLPDNQQAENS